MQELIWECSAIHCHYPLTRLFPRGCPSIDIRTQEKSSYLLCAPAGIGFPHVRRGLDRGNEFEGGVADADNDDDAAGGIVVPLVVQEYAPDEDVNCLTSVLRTTKSIALRGVGEPTNTATDE